jgi:endonuclease/exonuclease/phosphatase family metal-dependent hydrolase
MSFNIRYGTAEDGANAWPRRRDLLARTVLACEPDVLATQECLADQAAFLREALPGSGFAGAGRDDGALAGEMCALFWNAARWAKLDGGHFWLSETPEAAGSRGWDAALPRIASWVKLRATDDSTLAFCVVNAHFDHVGEVARRESARLLRERSLTIAGGLPLVIAGDFNAPADANADGPYALLTTPAGGAGSGFVDTYRSLSPPGPDEGTYHAFAGTTTGARIDWILVSPDIAPVAAAIDRTSRAGRYPSDHFPVTAVVRIGAR